MRRIAAVCRTSGTDGERAFSATHGGPCRLRYDPPRKVGPDEVSKKMSTTPDNTLADTEQRIADLERQLAEREAELAEAREQQTATAEVL